MVEVIDGFICGFKILTVSFAVENVFYYPFYAFIVAIFAFFYFGS